LGLSGGGGGGAFFLIESVLAVEVYGGGAAKVREGGAAPYASVSFLDAYDAEGARPRPDVLEVMDGERDDPELWRWVWSILATGGLCQRAFGPGAQTQTTNRWRRHAW
jgi:hypothetical protein